jgi:hypothetical protein
MTAILIILLLLIIVGLVAYISSLENTASSPTVPVPARPEIGESYVLSENDPFSTTTVLIRDVKNDWVQYYFVYGGRVGSSPVSKQIDSFLRIYTKIS